MYDRDMPLMRAHALASDQGFCDVVAFVLCTIRQPLRSVGGQMADIRLNGADSKWLFGSKREGYRYALAHASELRLAVAEAPDAAAAVDVLTSIPGLGIVKAAFIAQICGHEVACLDGHNLKRLGMAESALKLAKSVKPETRRRKIASYVALCARTGGSRHWWNSWCEYVAGNRANRTLATADAVSAYHVACLA
jgi:hypothetical protein